MDTASLNLAWSRALLAGLRDGGLRHVVASPGSRSTPLVIAANAADGVSLHVIIDERSAAFFALGLAKAGGEPVGLVSTSGSAPAHWYPAVIEAAMDRHPLVCISADRPEELTGWGANQTIDQDRLFGVHVRRSRSLSATAKRGRGLDHARAEGVAAAAAARHPVAGPVHVNVAFREPLVPADIDAVPEPNGHDRAVSSGRAQPDDATVSRLAGRLGGGRGVIVCGRGVDGRAADGVARLAERLAVPVLADPLSGLRCGEHDLSRVMTHYDAYLRAPSPESGLQPDWVLQAGATPVSAATQEWIARVASGRLILVQDALPWSDPGHAAGEIVHADVGLLAEALLGETMAPCDADWCESFVQAEQRCESVLEDRENRPVEADLVAAICRAWPASGLVFAGNSTVVRDFDAFTGKQAAGARLVGNRGASGIDGNVSTVFGLAAAGQGPVLGVVGDVALAHDIGGLAASRHASATLVVINNGGGAIFDYLPQAGHPDFERLWLTPPGLDLAEAAALYGLEHVAVTDTDKLLGVIGQAAQGGGSMLVELVVDREQSLRRHLDYRASVAGRPVT